MTQLRKTRLLYKLLSLMLPLVVVSIVLTATVISWTNYAFFRKTIQQDYGHIVTISASEIKLFMENARRDLESLAWLLRFSPPGSRHSDLSISAFQFAKPKFTDLRLVAADGADKSAVNDQGRPLDAHASRIIAKALEGKFTLSGVIFNKSYLPMIYMAVPVQHLGKIDSVLCGCLNLKWVWDVLDGINIGQTGHISILEQSGRPVGHWQMDRVVMKQPVVDADILKKIKMASKPISWIRHHDGKRHFYIASYIPEQDWIIVLSQNTLELFAYLHSNIASAALLGILICAAAAMLGGWQIRRFTRPIQTLHDQVQRIGSGNLDHQVSVASTDEIGELANAFNVMTASLKKKIAQEIQSARQLAHTQNLALLGATTTKVTHEVGNLLNNVGMAASALEGENLSRAGATALTQMKKESDRVRAFIQSFLQFAKPSELRLKRVRLDLIIRETLAMHEQMAKAQGITLSFEWPANAPEVPADVHLIYQALNNLIKNGIEATERTGTLKIIGTFDQENLDLSIEDSGSGIAPEHLDRIFDPFFTTKGKQGTGLGTAIAKSIITAHRGTITCQSEPGRGTCFRICLPLR